MISGLWMVLGVLWILRMNCINFEKIMLVVFHIKH